MKNIENLFFLILNKKKTNNITYINNNIIYKRIYIM